MIDDYFDEASLALGVVLIVLGLVMFRRTRRFIARCRTGEGHISRYTTEDSDEGVYYFSRIRFRDEAGTEHEIPGRGFQQPPVVGTPVPVTYDLSYPTNAWITGTGSPWVIPWIVALAGLAFVVASFVIAGEG